MLARNKIINTLFKGGILLCTSLWIGSVFAGEAQKELLKVSNVKASGAYVRTRFLAAMTTPLHPDAKKKALIIGDSHAQDFFNGVLENNYLTDYKITTRYIPTRCQIYLGKNYQEFIAAKDKVLCKKSDSLLKAKQDIANADLIILSAKWRKWAAENVLQTLTNLALKPQQKLVVIGVKSFGRVSIRKYLRLSDDKLRGLRNEIDGNQQEVNELMKQAIPQDVFVNTHQLVCGSGSTCPLFTKELKLISFDGGHLTKAGARFVGNVLFQGAVLRDLK